MDDTNMNPIATPSTDGDMPATDAPATEAEETTEEATV